MVSLSHSSYMQQALDLATCGIRGANPLVGAVIVDEAGTIVAQGYHQGAGTPHAEVDALSHMPADIDPQTLTIYVTLEPCNHTGRTGPCSQAIIKAGLKQVVMAAFDPTPQASGGYNTLVDAGIDVEVGVLEQEALHINERWFKAQQENRPFVTAKFAQTLDGKIAAIDGSSKWITGEQARLDTHHDRLRVDAMIVGTGTILADDPALTARVQGAKDQDQPLSIVIGKREVPKEAKVRNNPAGFIQIQSHDLKKALETAKEQGIHHAMVEGGATLLAEFFKADLVDQVICYIAPKILGAGKSAIGELGIENISQALELEYDPISKPELLGEDVKLYLIPRKKA